MIFLTKEKNPQWDGKIQTSIPLALLNLQYTSVNVIMPPSSLKKKSNEKLSVASSVSYHSLKVYFNYCSTTLELPAKHVCRYSFLSYLHEYLTLPWIQLNFRTVSFTIESWMCSRILSDVPRLQTLHTYNCLFIPATTCLSVSLLTSRYNKFLKQSSKKKKKGKTQ